jgi:hypothetical protein
MQSLPEIQPVSYGQSRQSLKGARNERYTFS